MYTFIKNKYFFLLATALILVAASCKKEDPFDGRDNYIASFSLKQGSTVVSAKISAQTILISVPEGFSLNGATATVQMSEHATIYPDPSTITDWDDETQFAVTSRSGEQIQYRYTVERKHINAEGTVVLETQADVDAFAQTGFTAIGGNLVIGRTIGPDSIRSLAGLANLKEIAYSLTIHPTYAGENLTGLDNLEKLGNEIRMDGLKNLATVDFPKLKTAGEIYIRNTLTGAASFPELTSVNRGFTLDAPLTEFRLPNLKSVGGKLTLNTLHNSNAMLPQIAFPALEEAGSFSCTFFKNATKVSLPELKKVGDLFFSQMTLLSVLIVPKLEISTGIITIPSTAYLSEISFPSLTQAFSIVADSKMIRVFDFPKLKTVKGRLSIQNLLINGITGFKSLEKVEGELYLFELPVMSRLDFPVSLQQVGKLTVYNRLTNPLTEIDIRKLVVGELKVMANAIKTKLIGNSTFNGTLTVSSNSAVNNNGFPSFPILEGFNEVDSLSLDGYVGSMDTVHIRNIRKINKGFRLENNDIKRFSMPDLEEIGGNFFFARLDKSLDERLEFAKLKKIGGSFDLQVGSTKIRTLSFPLLESVGGNFKLGTGYNAERSLEKVQFPALKTITGNMLLHGYGGSNSNQLLTNLDGFTTLNNVQSIEITNQKAILSFEGLKAAFNGIPSTGWKTTGNKYNPTYQDLANGNWVAP